MRVLILCVICFCFVVCAKRKASERKYSAVRPDLQSSNDKSTGPKASRRYHPPVSDTKPRKNRNKAKKRQRRPNKAKKSSPAHSNDIYLPVPRPLFRTVDLYSVKSQKPAQPYSGELIRLRGNSTYLNSGLVEVFRRGQWGIVCDDDWDLNDASVACRQLGFQHGATAAPIKARYGYDNYTENEILMDQVDCNGQEQRLQQCQYHTVHDCKQFEAASVVCQVNKGCQEGWVSGFGSCYKFFGGARNLRDASTKCSQLDSSLVNIETEEENNFLSNVVSLTAPNTKWWYTGGKRTRKSWNWYQVSKSTIVRRGRTIKRLRSRKFHMTFQKWFPGWPPSDYNSQPSTHRRHNCLVLTNVYHHPSGNPTHTNYFYWSAFPCILQGKTLDFICEKSATKGPKECYVGKGTDYRGMKAVTIKGTPCLNWTDSETINPTLYQKKGLGKHNYCRNPDNDTRPWCWVSHKYHKYGYCSVPQCSDEHATTLAPLTEEAWGPDCPVNQFFCQRTSLCIPEDYHCDGEVDCEDREDETNCAYEIEQFVKYRNKEVSSINNNATYIGITLEMCAKHCLNSRLFVCRSLVYALDDHECIITDVNRQMIGELENSTKYDYFELKTQAANCTNMFQCSNGKCIPETDVCNQRDDCNDFSDETNCGSAESLEVRLVGGDEHSGTVEVKYMGEWGIICDDDWDINDAHVVCLMLGYEYCVRETIQAEFGEGNGNILLSHVDCLGNETSLSECKKPAWREHNCHPYEAAGVVCVVNKACDSEHFLCLNKNCIPFTMICDGSDDCRDGSDEKFCGAGDITVELVNGTRSNEGRVEIIRNGIRGTICDDGWDRAAATVVCRMLGYNHGGLALDGAYYGKGNGTIWLDDLACGGTEKNIFSCTRADWAVHNCNHIEDAGVRCYLSTSVTGTTTTTTTTMAATTTMTTTESPLKVYLVGGSSENEGRVEVTFMGVRGTVCDDEWDDLDAEVVCRMLGYNAGGTAYGKAAFGQGKGAIMLDDVECYGVESTLTECDFSVWGSNNCDHSEDAGVRCHTTTTEPPTTVASRAMKIELVGGSSEGEGRVEIIRDRIRGTICDDDWDDSDASVICKMLGFTAGGVAYKKAHYGPGSRSSPIWLDDVSCDGSEESILQCKCSRCTGSLENSPRAWNKSNCDHSEDAGVKCTPSSSAEVYLELVGGSSDNEGRVEIIKKGVRGTICDDDWDDQDATVICKMLGYRYGGIAKSKAFFGAGKEESEIWLSNIECKGTEDNLGNCDTPGWAVHACEHSEDAGVICKLKADPATVAPARECGLRPLWHKNRRKRAAANETIYNIKPAHFSKIVGGHKTEYGLYPWQARVEKIYNSYSDGSVFAGLWCGGTIINDMWILSAAHCYQKLRKSQIRILVGDHHPKRHDQEEQVFEVAELIPHHRYDKMTHDFDIALIKVKPKNGRGIRFSDYVQPACLPGQDMEYRTGMRCLISGWGEDFHSGVNKRILQAAVVPLISPNVCHRLYKYAISPRMLCAGYIQGGVDTCQGDSGGPLVCEVNDLFTVLGVTSWGNGCAKPKSPGVYSKVSMFLPWIEQKVRRYS